MFKPGNIIYSFFNKRIANTKKFFIGTADFYYYTIATFKSITKLNRSHIIPFIDVVINQVKFTGLHALFILSFIAVTIGGLTIINAMPALQGFGQKHLISNILIFVIVREIGPIITGIIVIIRSGAAITSEIATQKLNKEIYALELHGIDPFQYIVMPRVLAGIISTVCLIIYFDILAFLGGYLFAVLLNIDISSAEFFSDILRSITLNDFFSSISKGLFFGLIIPLICTYYGFRPEKIYEVPIFVREAVVKSLIVLFAAGGFISTLFYL